MLTPGAEKIPPACPALAAIEGYDCEQMVIRPRPTSPSTPVPAGEALTSAVPSVPTTLVENVHHPGPGGDQKLAFTYATLAGFDVVAVLRRGGDDEDALLARLLEPITAGAADAVFGTIRNPSVLDALLTWLQNRILGERRADWHGSYRVYSVAMLSQLRFDLNADGAVFDTQMALQLASAGARLVEVPVASDDRHLLRPAARFTFALRVLLTTLGYAAHRSALLFRERYDSVLPGNLHYDLKLDYASSHSYALAAVPAGASVLDIGSGIGAFARELRRKGCRVSVVDRFRPEGLDPDVDVIVQDLDAPLRFETTGYRYLLLLDVLEHLKDPEVFLDRLATRFDDAPRTVILTVPNVAFVVQRLMLLVGQFNYGKVGILDRTHRRLFTESTLLRLLKERGCRVTRICGTPAPFPKVLGLGFWGRGALAVNRLLIRLSRGLFAYQIYVEAETTPSLAFVLRRALERRSRSGASSDSTAAPPQTAQRV